MRYTLLLIPPLLWSTMLVVGQAILVQIPPATLTFWTWLTAALCLLPYSALYLKNNMHRVRHEILPLFFFALFGISGFQYLIFSGLTRASAISASVLSPTIPVMVACLGWRFLGEKLRSLQIMGLLISFAGVCWISSHGDWTNLLELRLGPGELLILLANLFIAIYTVMLRMYPSKLQPIAFMSVLALLGTAQVLPLSLIESGFLNGITLAIEYSWTVLYIGIVNYCLAYVFWNISVKRHGASTTGIYLYLIPVFGTLLSYVFLQELIHSHHVIGVLLIFSGLYFSLHFGDNN